MNGFWNHRELYSSLQICSQEYICKERVDEGKFFNNTSPMIRSAPIERSMQTYSVRNRITHISHLSRATMLRNYPWFSLREIRPVFNWDKRRFVIYNEYINYRILDYLYLACTWDEWSCWPGIVSLSRVHVACTALKQICKQINERNNKVRGT